MAKEKLLMKNFFREIEPSRESVNDSSEWW